MPNRKIDIFGGYYRPLDDDLDTVIIGIDPGVTTGISAVVFNSKKVPMPNEVEHWGSDQISYGGSGNAKDLIEAEGGFAEQKIAHKIGEMIFALSQYSGSPDKNRRVLIVIEDFIIRQQNSTRDFLAPVRITAGIIQEIFYMENAKVVFQTPADAKAICTDDRMDKWGFTIKTTKDRHSRDADRHAILFLRRILEKPHLMKVWSSSPR